MDFDLAHLYQVETRRLKETVRRNRKKFPEDFMFELTKEEYDTLRTQFASSKRGGRRYAPFAFTEHGVAMAAAVLNSDMAIDMNIAIVRAFIAPRQLTMQRYDFLEQLQQLHAELHQLLMYMMHG